MTAPAERWAVVLDELEDLLDRQRDAAAGHPVDADAVAVLLFSPPDDLPPIPASLADRAHRLLARTRELAEAVAAAADGIRPVARPDRPLRPAVDRRSAGHVDHRI